MSLSTRLKRLVPLAISVAIIAFAARVLIGTLTRIRWSDVLATLYSIPIPSLLVGALLMVTLYAALAYCEVRIAEYVDGPVSPRRAILGVLLAAPIGHAIGWGAVSGGAIRYRIYSGVGMRGLDVGKMVLLASIPYPAGLGLLLGLSLVVQSDAAAAILHVQPSLARGAGLALLVLHAIYLGLIAVRRGPMSIGKFLLTLPPPRLTAIQYGVGVAEVCCGAGILYALLPPGLSIPFAVFLGVYVLCILTALASSVPAGIGVFESVILLLLPGVPPAELLGRVIAYRAVLEVIPFCVSLLLFATYEVWWRLPAQRARVALQRAEHDND